MDKKKRAVGIVILLFLLVAVAIVYIFSELYSEEDMKPVTPEVTGAQLFKEEYESINNNELSEGIFARTISIAEENPFVYASEDDIVKMIEEGKTFVAYFGFAKCPWCRSVLESLIEEAKANNIDTIYYVNVADIRDTYELNEKNEAVRTKEGSTGYYKLLELLDSVLDDYTPLTYKNSKGKTKKVTIDEKRIYAPNVLVVKNGKALGIESGISSLQKDAYEDLTEEMIKEEKYIFNCLFQLLVDEDSNMCICENQKC